MNNEMEHLLLMEWFLFFSLSNSFKESTVSLSPLIIACPSALSFAISQTPLSKFKVLIKL